MSTAPITMRATKAARLSALERATAETTRELQTLARAVALRGLQRLGDVIDGKGPLLASGATDSGYVTALRLALQAGGVLNQHAEPAGEGRAAGAFVLPARDAPEAE